jgi:hypothetical protein
MRLSFAVIVLVVSLLSACGTEGLSSTSPVIEVLPLALDFGPVPTGLEVSLPVQVRNLGKGTLELRPPRVDSADFGISPATVSIPGGERIDVDLTFKPTTEGLLTGVVRLFNNSSNDADVAIAVSGVGIPRTVCVECNTPTPIWITRRKHALATHLVQGQPPALPPPHCWHCGGARH